jgi:hypothetical protein
MPEQEFNAKLEQLQSLFGEISEKLGQEVGFIKRRRKFSALAFVLLVVMGWLGDKEASLNKLVRLARRLQLEISEVALHKKLNKSAVEMLSKLVMVSLEHLLEKYQLQGVKLKQFTAIYLMDSTQISLPAHLATEFPGFNKPGAQAMLKLQLCFDYLSGQVKALRVEAGRCADQGCELMVQISQAGSLHLFDLGYFKLAHFQNLMEGGAYFISRYHYSTGVYETPDSPQALDLGAWLGTCPKTRQTLTCYLGSAQRLPVRLVAFPLPPDHAEKRRRQAHKKARGRGTTPSQA